ncbi:MAG: hypothetical protein LBK75_09220 [Oscillospiraceae bacterium]|jgi:hypothetical protein|nr:hypothetical protein [Oscillospiraceae bacterium]
MSAVTELTSAGKVLMTIKAEMICLAKLLPEYDAVLAMYGIARLRERSSWQSLVMCGVFTIAVPLSPPSLYFWKLLVQLAIDLAAASVRPTDESEH